MNRALLFALLMLGCRGRCRPQGDGLGNAEWDRRVTAVRQQRTTPTLATDDLPAGEPAFVALIVLDTVRADRTSLCGYDKPTTPTLKALADKAVVRCDAYSPATWTLPAHASLFSGQPTAEHGVHTLGTPLADSAETLAETFAGRGYQTLFLSGNPVFNGEAGGFWQGFDRVVVAKALTGPMRGPSMSEILEHELKRLDPSKPLFLVLNIFDAHDPYPAVPNGVPWATAMGRTNLLPHTAKPDNPYYAFVTGQMKAEARPAYLARIQNAYPWAVHEADANLAEALKALRDHGWARKPHRMVITSDHGEHLGEHELLRHGSAAWQSVVRVPFLYLDGMHPEGTAPVALPDPLSTLEAWHLLRDGAPASPARPVTSASAHNPEDFKPSWLTVAWWASTTDKWLHFDGEDRRYDLSVDPGELSPGPIDPTAPTAAALAAEVGRQRASIEAATARGIDPAVLEMLKVSGYVQDDDEEPAPPPPENEDR